METLPTMPENSIQQENGIMNNLYSPVHGCIDNERKSFGDHEFENRVKFINSCCERHSTINSMIDNNNNEEKLFVSCAEIQSNIPSTHQSEEFNPENEFNVDVKVKLEVDDSVLMEFDKINLSQTSNVFNDSHWSLPIYCFKKEFDMPESFQVYDASNFKNNSFPTHSTTIFPSYWRNYSPGNIFDLKPCQVMLKRIDTPRSKGKIKYTCDHCKKTYSCKKSLRKHIFSHLKKNIQCRYCRLPFQNEAVLQEHLISTHKHKVRQCKYCEKHFSNLRYFINHSTRMHPKTGSSKLNCAFCKKSFLSKCSLKKHLDEAESCRIRLGGKFVCKICGYTSRDQSNFGRHLREVHFMKALLRPKKNTLPPYQCPICCQPLKRRSNMKRHFQKVHGDPPEHSQPKASLPSIRRLMLKQSYLQSSKNVYQCVDCDALFAQKGHLARHEGIHKNVRIPCQYCHKTFSDPSSLRKHTSRFHLQSGETLHKCADCGALFTQKNHLTRHKDTHKNV